MTADTVTHRHAVEILGRADALLFGRVTYQMMEAAWRPRTGGSRAASDTHVGSHRMIVEARVTMDGSRAAIWAAITDIEHASETMSGIERIEVLERPANGLVGLKWRETRMLFGKPATADKWITNAAENEFYDTRAEDNGFVFISTLRISEGRGGMTLTSRHESRPRSLGWGPDDGVRRTRAGVTCDQRRA